MTLPGAAQTAYRNEYIGHLVVPKVKAGTWMGLSHQSAMTGSLLLMTWLDDDEAMTSLRHASGYVAPDMCTGNAMVSEVSHSSNDTHYFLTYRCEDCWSWDQDGATGSQVPATTASAAQLVGWAYATNPPTSPSESDSALQQHANDGIFAAVVASAHNTAYTDWITKAIATASPTAAPHSAGNGTSATATGSAALSTAAATAAVCPETNTVASTIWDYFIVGAGAGGIPFADKLSESGASVLLVEKGPPSSGRWGGTMKSHWLVGTNLSRFDVPGPDNEIWKDSAGIACDDYSVMAGCVLGGGTAVNAGLWWRANPQGFDYNFPSVWKSTDKQPAISRVFERIPFTDRPSMDGKLYKPQGYEIVGGALAAAGWASVTAVDVPAEKNYTFSHPNEMFSQGERGGPVATYLVTAHARRNFKLVTNTSVTRDVRSGGLATGVELAAFLADGECGTVKVTQKTGKAMVTSQYLGRVKTSRGRTVINGGLDMTVSQTPYVNNKNDLAAIKAGFETVFAALVKDPQINVQFPAANTSVDDWLASYPLTTSSRSANHWMGRAKMGLDSGLINNGTSVVDTNAKVYGMSNLFIVDASIFPGMLSTNPSALTVSVAEKAPEIIPNVVVKDTSTVVSAKAPYGNDTATAGLPAFPRGTGSVPGVSVASAAANSTLIKSVNTITISRVPNVSVAPVYANSASECTSTVTVRSTRSSAVSTSLTAPPNDIANSTLPDLSATFVPVTASSASAPYSLPANSTTPCQTTVKVPASKPVASSGYVLLTASAAPAPDAGVGAVAEWQRCGGTGYTGATSCAEDMICKDWNPYYSQYVKPGKI